MANEEEVTALTDVVPTEEVTPPADAAAAPTSAAEPLPTSEPAPATAATPVTPAATPLPKPTDEAKALPKIESDGGSVIGLHHLFEENGDPCSKGNQDAFGRRTTDHGHIAVVADGCSKGDFSSVGASLFVLWFLNAAEELLADPMYRNNAKVFVKALDARMLTAIKAEAEKMTRPGADLANTLYHFFLFTVLASVSTKKWTVVFGCGDGVYSVNNNAPTKLEPKSKNRPQYITYRLYSTLPEGFTAEDVEFTVHELLPTSDVSQILIATDGAAVFVDSPDTEIPDCHGERVGELTQFFQQFRFSALRAKGSEQSAISDKLLRMNRGIKRAELAQMGSASGRLTDNYVQLSIGVEARLVEEPGLLDDDTTIVVMSFIQGSVSRPTVRPTISLPTVPGVSASSSPSPTSIRAASDGQRLGSNAQPTPQPRFGRRFRQDPPTPSSTGSNAGDKAGAAKTDAAPEPKPRKRGWLSGMIAKGLESVVGSDEKKDDSSAPADANNTPKKKE